MLPDAALRSIADNLAALRLDPVLHLKVAVAIVGPLMHSDGQEAKPNRSPPRRRGRVVERERNASKPMPTAPIPISYSGQTFPSRSALAKHLAPIFKRSVPAVLHALSVHHDNAEAVARAYAPAQGPARAFSPHEQALRFLKDKLARGPCAASVVDDEIERGRLSGPSVEKAKTELGLVARRISNGKGAVVHLCTAAQAAELEA